MADPLPPPRAASTGSTTSLDPATANMAQPGFSRNRLPAQFKVKAAADNARSSPVPIPAGDRQGESSPSTPRAIPPPPRAATAPLSAPTKANLPSKLSPIGSGPNPPIRLRPAGLPSRYSDSSAFPPASRPRPAPVPPSSVLRIPSTATGPVASSSPNAAASTSSSIWTSIRTSQPRDGDSDPDSPPRTGDLAEKLVIAPRATIGGQGAEGLAVTMTTESGKEPKAKETGPAADGGVPMEVESKTVGQALVIPTKMAKAVVEEGELDEQKLTRIVDLCTATLRDPSGHPALNTSLATLFDLLQSRLPKPSAPAPPPPPPSNGGFLDFVDMDKKIDAGLNARMVEVKAVRDQEIEALKKEAAERDAQRDALKSQLEELQAKVTKIEAAAAGSSRAAAATDSVGKGSEGADSLDATSFALKVDERIKLSRKSLMESIASKFEADTTKKVKDLTIRFEARVQDIDLGFKQWWDDARKDLDAWFFERRSSIKAEVAAESAHSRASTGSVPSRSAPDARRSAPTLAQAATSRLPPAAPSSRPSSTSAARSASRPQSPIEPAHAPAPSSSSGDLVTSSQLVTSRTKCVGEIRELDKKLDKELKKFHDKLSRLGALIDGGGGSGSAAASPSSTRASGHVQTKKARPEEPGTADSSGGDERPHKRVRSDEGPSTADLAGRIEAAHKDAQATKDAVARIAQLESAVEALQSSIRNAQDDIAQVVTIGVSLEEVVAATDKSEADNKETLKRMADGDKRVARTAEIELQKAKDRLDTHVTDLSRIEKDLGNRITDIDTKISDLETTLDDKISTVKSASEQVGKEKDDLKRKLHGIEADCKTLQDDITESTDRQRTDRTSNATALRQIRDMLEAKVDLAELTRKLETKVDLAEMTRTLETKVEQQAFEQQLASKTKDIQDAAEKQLAKKVDQTVYQRGIDELSDTVSTPQPISPKAVLPLIEHVLAERKLDQVVANFEAVRSSLSDLNKAVVKVETNQNQALDVCHLTIQDIKQEVLDTAQSIETIVESAKQADPAARLDAYDVASAEMTESIAQIKSDLEQLRGSLGTVEARPDLAPSVTKLTEEVTRISRRPDQLESEIKDLRSKFESHQSSLEALRSKPTPPASPVLAASSSSNALSILPLAPTATSAPLDSTQTRDLLTTLLREIEDTLATTGSRLHTRIESMIAPTKQRAETMQVKLDGLDLLLSSVKRLGEATDDSFREFRRNSDKTSTVDLSPRVKKLEELWHCLAPTIDSIHTRLLAIVQEHQAAASNRSVQAQNPSHANFSAQPSTSPAVFVPYSMQQQLQQAHQQQQQQQQQPLRRSREARPSDGGGQRPSSSGGAPQPFANPHQQPLQPFSQSGSNVNVYEAPTYNLQ
ncbi:hypothetical protein JCM11491_000409 [Sporobolomyces phaffii]